jgi:hypothetical protein
MRAHARAYCSRNSRQIVVTIDELTRIGAANELRTIASPPPRLNPLMRLIVVALMRCELALGSLTLWLIGDRRL